MEIASAALKGTVFRRCGCRFAMTRARLCEEEEVRRRSNLNEEKSIEVVVLRGLVVW